MGDTIYLDRKDKTVDQIARIIGYNGRRVHAEARTTVRFYGTNWDEGNKRDYTVINLATMESDPVGTSPYFADSPLHTADHAIPPGCMIAVHVQGRYEYMLIMCHPSNLTPMLPAPVDLTDDEKTVLIATRSLKSSYAGIKDYRFSEAKSRTGITRERWDAAKVAMIARGFLNKAGAITNAGRNVVGNESLPYGSY